MMLMYADGYLAFIQMNKNLTDLLDDSVECTTNPSSSSSALIKIFFSDTENIRFVFAAVKDTILQVGKVYIWELMCTLYKYPGVYSKACINK